MNFASFRSRILAAPVGAKALVCPLAAIAWGVWLASERKRKCPLQTLVHLRWVHITLDNVEDGDVHLRCLNRGLWTASDMKNCMLKAHEIVWTSAFEIEIHPAKQRPFL